MEWHWGRKWGNNVIAESLADNLETSVEALVPCPSQDVCTHVPKP